MPAYHGIIDTNKGIGHVFERIFDCDSQTSLTLDVYIRHIAETLSPQEAQTHLKSLLASFKARWFEEKIVTSNTELVNFMVQRKAPDDVSIRIVDNIGTPVLIPLAYYSELFAKKRVARYWKRLLQVLADSYSEIFTKELLDELALFATQILRCIYVALLQRKSCFSLQSLCNDNAFGACHFRKGFLQPNTLFLLSILKTNSASPLRSSLPP